MIRVEVRNRRSRELLDSADFKGADIAGEWFLAWARFCRIAAALGDQHSLGRARTSTFSQRNSVAERHGNSLAHEGPSARCRGRSVGHSTLVYFWAMSYVLLG